MRIYSLHAMLCSCHLYGGRPASLLHYYTSFTITHTPFVRCIVHTYHTIVSLFITIAGGRSKNNVISTKKLHVDLSQKLNCYNKRILREFCVCSLLNHLIISRYLNNFENGGHLIKIVQPP